MTWLRELRRRLRPRTRYRASAAGALGVASWVRWRLALARDRRAPYGTLLTLSSRLARFPLLARAGSTDLPVFRQIYVEREYAPLDDLREASLIIDCGANVGYASAYFASRFPGAKLVAVEPDPGNFDLLVRNLAPYGERVTLVRSAVWSRRAHLALTERTRGPGREWARTVEECEAERDGAMVATDIPALLAGTGHDRVSILKMDVEGAEAEIFRRPCDWVDRVDLLVIELHRPPFFPDGVTPFYAAIEGRGFQLSQVGELTVCRRKPAAAALP